MFSFCLILADIIEHLTLLEESSSVKELKLRLANEENHRLKLEVAECELKIFFGFQPLLSRHPETLLRHQRLFSAPLRHFLAENGLLTCTVRQRLAQYES